MFAIEPHDGQLVRRRGVVIGRGIGQRIDRFEHDPDFAQWRLMDNPTAHFAATPEFAGAEPAEPLTVGDP
jgi:hypothetical protein